MKLCLSLLLSWRCHFALLSPPYKRWNGDDGGVKLEGRRAVDSPEKSICWLLIGSAPDYMCPPHPRKKVVIGQYRGDWQLAGCGIKITFTRVPSLYFQYFVSWIPLCDLTVCLIYALGIFLYFPSLTFPRWNWITFCGDLAKLIK